MDLSKEAPPARYDLAYSRELLQELAESFHGECHNLGLREFDPAVSQAAPVTAAVNDASREFRENPATFGQYEQGILSQILSQLGC